MGFGCGGRIDPACSHMQGWTIREYSSGERRRGCSDIDDDQWGSENQEKENCGQLKKCDLRYTSRMSHKLNL